MAFFSRLGSLPGDLHDICKDEFTSCSPAVSATRVPPASRASPCITPKEYALSSRPNCLRASNHQQAVHRMVILSLAGVSNDFLWETEPESLSLPPSSARLSLSWVISSSGAWPRLFPPIVSSARGSRQVEKPGARAAEVMGSLEKEGKRISNMRRHNRVKLMINVGLGNTERGALTGVGE